MKIDLTQIHTKYPGKWVVLDKETNVLASNRILIKAIEQFRAKYGTKTVPRVFKVPKKILPYVGSAR